MFLALWKALDRGMIDVILPFLLARTGHCFFLLEPRLSGRQDSKRRPRRRLLSLLVLRPYFAFHRVSVAVYVCACDLPLAHQVLVGSIHITVLAGDPGQLSPASDSVYQQLTEKEGFH